ncbi:MAG: hypothetical protein QNL12_12010 [Acidimicrobiia bacterium]|nr:hypothetical protein [Acidimicrobiia bacterium]MDX2468032.1 hypothetical protein [Acidimicrobiia bacterium]
MGPHRCGVRGVAIGLEPVSELFSSIEDSLAAGDWDGLRESVPVEPETTAADEQELRRLIAEADRLQRLIASYMDHIQADIDSASHVRRATTAYARIEASI